MASLTLAVPAAGDVIYSNLLDTAIPTNFDGVTISVNGGTINPFFGGVGVANDSALQPLRTGAGGLDTLRNLLFGSTIDSGSIHFSSGDGGSQDHLGNTFTAGEEGYIGFKLNGTNYGWMRVVFTNNTGGALVKDWAYDNSGASIVVGGIRQQGQNIILSSPMTVGSALSNSGGATNLLKNSAGLTTLTATNTYSGTTTISSGTLAVNGSGSINNSAVTLSGGTFRYNSSVVYSNTLTFTSGTIGGTNLTGSLGNLAIDDNQIIAPGNSTGTATTTDQTWAGGGTYQFEINDATGTAGAAEGWDLITGSGTLSVAADSTSRFTIAVTSLGLGQVEGDAVDFNDLTSYAWLIADFANITGFATTDFTINTSAFSNDFTGNFGIALGGTGGITGDSTQIYLTYSPVPIPEPGATLLGALSALSLLRRRRPVR